MTQCTHTKLHAILNSSYLQPDGGTLMSLFVYEEYKSSPPLEHHLMKVTIESPQGEVIVGHGYIIIEKDGAGGG
jgi:hypothetical protein